MKDPELFGSVSRQPMLRLGVAVGLALLFLVALLCGLSGPATVQALPGSDSPNEGPGLVATGGSVAAPVGVYGGEFRFGVIWEPNSLDPILLPSMPIVLGQIFEGLLTFDEDLNLVPAIATSWETMDAQTFIFTLRNDVYFHNGRQLTAQDVVYSWERLNPDILSDVVAVNSTTLSVTLDYPKIQWLYELPTAPYSVVPSETVSTIDWHPVGSGPFRFDSWTPGVAISLIANTNYYAGRPYLDRLVFPFYADEDAMYAAFQAGELDWSEVPDSEIANLSGDPNLVLHNRVGWTWVWMTLHLTPTNQIAVRRALNYAINLPDVINGTNAVAPGYYPQADSIVPPGLQGYDPVLSTSYTYSPSLALELLYSAGYTDTAPSDGVLDDGKGNDLTIELWTNAGHTARETAASLIADDWQDIGDSGIGISVTTVFTEWDTFLGNIFGKTMPAYIVGFSATPNPYEIFDVLFRTGAPFNNMGYSDAQVDAWLDQSMTTISLAERHALYQQIEERVLGDAPIMPLWYGGNAYIKAACVNGLVVPANTDIPFEKVYRCGVFLPVVVKNYGP
jgi:oligopeptide transport system substrate-binding protein